MQKRVTTVQKILLVFFGVLVAVLISETLFRLGGFIGKRMVSQSEKIVEKANYRILCIGDSSTFGLGSSNKAEFSYPAQLQAIINENVRDKSFDVVNLGLPGMNSSQVLHRFRENLLKYEPDIVIVMVGINDPWNLEENDVLKNYKRYRNEKILSGIRLLLNESRIFQFFKLIYVSHKMDKLESVSDKESFKEQKLVLPNFEDKALSRGFRYSLKNPARANALYNSIADNIMEIKQIAEEQNVIILFMKYHNSGWGRPEKIIHDTYANINVPVVDQLSVFRKAESLGMNIRGKDGWHPNDLGYLLMARSVFNKLVELKVIDSEPVEIFDETF